MDFDKRVYIEASQGFGHKGTRESRSPTGKYISSKPV